MRMMHAAVAEAALRKMMAAYSAEAPVREAPVSREHRSRGRRSQRKPQMITSDAAVAEQYKKSGTIKVGVNTRGRRGGGANPRCSQDR